MIVLVSSRLAQGTSVAWHGVFVSIYSSTGMRVSGADMNEGEENRTDIPEKVGRQGYGAGSN